MSADELSRWAAEMARRRWAGTTPEERIAHAKMMQSKVRKRRRKRVKKEAK
jgi:hypothetical protein